MTELLFFIGIVLFALYCTGLLDEIYDTPGKCKKCGREMVFTGYKGKTKCLFCEDDKPDCRH